MEKSSEPYYAWDGRYILPTWTDVQRWQERHLSTTGVPRTVIPSWFREILRGKKRLADLEQLPLIRG
jgi:hypothetical protein